MKIGTILSEEEKLKLSKVYSEDIFEKKEDDIKLKKIDRDQILCYSPREMDMSVRKRRSSKVIPAEG